MIDGAIIYLSTHPIFVGSVIVLMNLCGKYITIDMPKSVEGILAQPIIRLVFIFCVAFAGTRDVKISLIVTLLFIITLRFLLNEKSRNCILPHKYRYNEMLDLNKDGIVTKNEIIKAQQILENYKKDIVKRNAESIFKN